MSNVITSIGDNLAKTIKVSYTFIFTTRHLSYNYAFIHEIVYNIHCYIVIVRDGNSPSSHPLIELVK